MGRWLVTFADGSTTVVEVDRPALYDEEDEWIDLALLPAVKAKRLNTDDIEDWEPIAR